MTYPDSSPQADGADAAPEPEPVPDEDQELWGV